MREFINIMESFSEGAAPDEVAITGLKPRYEQLDLTTNDLHRFAKSAGSAEAFADRLAEPTSDAHGWLLKFYADSEAKGFPVEQPSKMSIPYVGQLVADKLGATGYRGLGNNPLPWADRHSNLMGGSGYVITTPDGRVFLDATLEDKTIYMAQISVEDRASGLGTKTMEAIHEVAMQHGWKVCIYKVVNPKFFSKFSWLKPETGGHTFVSKF